MNFVHIPQCTRFANTVEPLLTANPDKQLLSL